MGEKERARVIAEDIDGLLSTRLTPTAYLLDAPSIQEIAAIIARQEGYGLAQRERADKMAEVASEMASKMATAACGEVFPTVVSVAGYIDSQLQEVRSVLESLAPRTNVGVDEHCWCSKNLTDNSEQHDRTCQRARDLYGRLRTQRPDPPKG